MPIIRGSSLFLRIAEVTKCRALGHLLPYLAPLRPWPLLLHNMLYLAPARWQVTLCRAFDVESARRGFYACWRVGPSKTLRKSHKRKESLYKSM